MSERTKTTVYLDADDYRDLQGIARSRGATTAALIREAVSEYAARERKKPRPRSIGLGRSGRGDLAERADEHLAGLGEND